MTNPPKTQCIQNKNRVTQNVYKSRIQEWFDRTILAWVDVSQDSKTAVTWRLHWAGGSASKVADTHGRQIGAGHLEKLSACLCGPLHKAAWVSFYNMAAGFMQSEWPKSSK